MYEILLRSAFRSPPLDKILFPCYLTVPQGLTMKTKTLEIAERLHKLFMNLATHALAEGDPHLFQLYFNICNAIHATITPKSTSNPA